MNEPPGRGRWYERVGPSVAVVAAIYAGVIALLDPHGYLGTDTGGKVATLEAMVDQGTWQPDVGYWAAEEDPGGLLHPIYGTRPVDDGWVQVTTLPMLMAARPLYDIGGYRATLVLPAVGALLAALGGRAIARRLEDDRAGTLAFWVVALASPMAIYALDFWEHAPGVAAVVWAAVLALDALGGRRVVIAPLVAGALVALGSTMRNEVLVYTLVLVGATSLAMVVERRVVDALRFGALAVAGFVPVFLANAALEDAVGGHSRADRAGSAASGGGGDVAARLDEGLETTFAITSSRAAGAVVVGALLVGLVVVIVRDLLHGGREIRLVAAALGVVYLLVVLQGLGFVPGLFAAFPVAAAGLAFDHRRRGEVLLVAVAVGALPVVWAFQLLGGSAPQWGGRYVLPSSILLGAVGAVAIARRELRSPVAAVLAASIAVTAFGGVWLVRRSHGIADTFETLAAVDDDVLIARNAFFLREGGTVTLGRHWLGAEQPDDLGQALRIVERSGADDFAVFQAVGAGEIAEPGVRAVGVDPVDVLGDPFEIVHYVVER